jgi:diketogulonate reductase-like aldo/keto reductase
MTTRREFVSATTTGAMLIGSGAFTQLANAAAKGEVLRRPIPSTGEMIPAIGMGTSGSFQIPPDGAEYAALKEVLTVFFAGGSTLIDTAPTYGNAEDNLGPLLTDGGYLKKAFIATKLSGVSGRDEGLKQFNDTLRRLKTDKVQVLQVHNLRDWKKQMEVARELKKLGKVKYVGVTHYVDSAHDEIAEVVQATKPDFLQINHSVTNRGIEKRVLPLAKELGVAVLTNRNFNDGALFRQVEGKPLPGWAADSGITSWAQMFLKYSLSHAAVTAVIPATGKPERQADNLKAGLGKLLTEKQQKELIALVG